MKVNECKIYDVESTSKMENLKFLKVTDAPFRIFGAMHDGEGFTRIPKEFVDGASESIRRRFRNTAGARLRFNTNSPNFSIIVKLAAKTEWSFFYPMAMSTFDVYAGKRHVSSVTCDEEKTTYQFDKPTRNGGRATVTMDFPLAEDVVDVYIGLEDGSEIWEAEGYSIERPVVFYGSSVTQGLSASRPGMTYAAQLSREFDFDHINLGFFDGVDETDTMANYIAGLDMTAFVYDTDVTASPEKLEKIHESTFLKIREKQPDTPVVFVTAPYLAITDDVKARYEIVKRTYENAVARGDENVYFVSALDYFPEDLRLSDLTTDGEHFNDIAYFFMKEAIKPILAKILEK